MNETDAIGLRWPVKRSGDEIRRGLMILSTQADLGGGSMLPLRDIPALCPATPTRSAGAGARVPC
jgi:hypothetical protein